MGLDMEILSNKIRVNYLIITIVSIVASVFAVNFASNLEVSAQRTPEYLLGNISLSNNLTAAQAQEISDKIDNYTETIKQKAKGNLTKMSMLLIDDLLGRKIIDEKDKQEASSFVTGLNQIKPLGNLTIGDRD